MSTAAARSGGGASSAVNQRAVDFRRQLDEHTRTLVESFGGLLRSAKITNPQSTTREEFQVNVATASLASTGEGLLRQIKEVKLAVMLQDEAAMDREVDQGLSKIAAERAELEKELEALSHDLKAAYARAATTGRETTATETAEAAEEAAAAEVEAAVAAAAAAAAATEAPAPAPAAAPAAGETPASAAVNIDATAAVAAIDHSVGNSMDVAEEEGGGKQEKAAPAAVGAEEASR